MTNELGFIHEFVPGSSERSLLMLHGTGGDEQELLPLGRVLDSSASVLSPRGKVLENGRPRFFRRLAEGVFDLEDLRQRTDELADFIVAASEHYGLDRNKMVAVGYSNGANIAASILLRRSDILRAAVLLRAMVPFEPAALPDLRGIRVWIAGGESDTIIPREQTERLAEMLASAGAEVTARFFPAGHGLTSTELAVVQRWLTA
jgi:predicted esterase